MWRVLCVETADWLSVIISKLHTFRFIYKTVTFNVSGMPFLFINQIF